MIDRLIELRDRLTVAIAIMTEVLPVLAAWRATRGAENGVDALAGPSVPAEPSSAPGEPAAAAPTGRQDALEGVGGTILPPDDAGTPDQPLTAAEEPPRRGRRRAPALTEAEQRERQREWSRRAYAKKRAAKEAQQAEIAAEAPESAPTEGVGTTLARNGSAPSDAAPSAAYGASEGARPCVEYGGPITKATQAEAEPEVAELEPLRDLDFGERPFRAPHRLFQDPGQAEREKFLELPPV